jgi:hypothetical protein
MRRPFLAANAPEGVLEYQRSGDWQLRDVRRLIAVGDTSEMPAGLEANLRSMLKTKGRAS